MAAPGIAVPGTVVPVGALTSPGGAEGIGGLQGPTGATGPPGPNVVSADAGNQATLGSDNRIYVPAINPNAGILQYVSATQLSFLPYKGGYIRINGLYYPIPSTGNGIAGLTNTNCYVNGVAGQNLAASTLYRVYCFNNAGTLTADFSTTAHATSTTPGNVGTEIKSGDDTRTLIGLIQHTGSSQFADTATQRYVRSWFNGTHRTFWMQAAISITATTLTATAVSAAIVSFANEPIFAGMSFYGTATASTNVSCQLNVDGTGYGASNVTTTGLGSKYENGAASTGLELSEGQHVIALFGSVGAANTFTGNGTVSGTVG